MSGKKRFGETSDVFYTLKGDHPYIVSTKIFRVPVRFNINQERRYVEDLMNKKFGKNYMVEFDHIKLTIKFTERPELDLPYEYVPSF
jgi:hypothetical protein